MNVSYYNRMVYEKRTLGERGKNEPKTNPNEPNLSCRSLWRSRIKPKKPEFSLDNNKVNFKAQRIDGSVKIGKIAENVCFAHY